jgi:hypothetical protein
MTTGRAALVCQQSHVQTLAMNSDRARPPRLILRERAGLARSDGVMAISTCFAGRSPVGGFTGPRTDDGALVEVKAPRADGTLSP